MTDTWRTPRLLSALLLALVLTSLTMTLAFAVGDIDPTDKWAWGANTGWLSLSSLDGSVMVYSDHLEGYAWGENTGWLRLGTYEGGGAHTYPNNADDDYGVNNDGRGNLSGYAWGTNVGWVNFDPEGSERVTIDPATGKFDGYAWGENIGWIHFRGGEGVAAYGVTTAWRRFFALLPLLMRNAP